MDHYLELRILPDPEFPIPLLMNALFAKLHRAFVQTNNRSLGISFPDVKQERILLGGRLRIHGTFDDLQKLMAHNWLTGMRDHVDLTNVTPVPPNAAHCRVKRVQVQSSAERLRRRYAKRHTDVTTEDLAVRIPDSIEKKIKLPYLRLTSQSTGQRFCVFLEHLAPQKNAVLGGFNSYGLSSEATVPWF